MLICVFQWLDFQSFSRPRKYRQPIMCCDLKNVPIVWVVMCSKYPVSAFLFECQEIGLHLMFYLLLDHTTETNSIG